MATNLVVAGCLLQVSGCRVRGLVSGFAAGFAVVVGGFLVTGKPVLLLQYAGYWILTPWGRKKRKRRFIVPALSVIYHVVSIWLD